jgi:YopX protein
MHRKIKFKFYDRKRKKLFDVLVIDWMRGLVTGSHLGKMDVFIIEQGDLLLNTGRKDKYKNEIYDKDILIENDGLGEIKLEVYWDDKLSGFQCRRDNYTGPIPDSKNIEIIGNMNEHPELMNDN